MGDQGDVVMAAPVEVDVTMTEAAPVLETVKDVVAEHEELSNGNVNAVCPPDGEVQPSVDDVIAPTSEEERLWGLVRENAADFNAWTELIQETEKSENIVKIEKAYDAFLGEFPLCYGYWKKYADHEAKLGFSEKIVDVYERAVKAVTYSVDIWMHYSAYAMEKFDSPEDTRRFEGKERHPGRRYMFGHSVVWQAGLSCVIVAMVDRIFERGVSFVETDYLSHLLWDKYIEFEYSQQEWSRLAQIYTRILQIPLQHLDRYNTSFKQIAHSRPLAELRTPEETAAAVEAEAKAIAAAEVEAEAKAIAAAEAKAEEKRASEDIIKEKEATESADDVPDADVPLPDADVPLPVAEVAEVAEVTEVTEITEAIDGAAIPDKEVEFGDSKELEEYLAVRESFYKAAKERDSKIRDFELAIRRPYFHVKPLDEAQLGNWHRYLDFIEKEGGFDKTVKLYERCLIACANYPEYWIRYVQRMDIEGKPELALKGLGRATSVFVKRRPEIHIFAARFREQQGDVDGARAAFEILRNELVPGLLEVFVKQANFEQRQGNAEAACSVFDAALQSEKLKEESRALTVLYIQYARFLDQVLKSEDKARELYMTALDHLHTSKALWEAAIYFEGSHTTGQEQVKRVDALVEQASAPLRPDGSPGLLAADREEISSVHLEFVDLVGDFDAIKKAEARHRQLFASRKSLLDSKKRASAEMAGQDRAKIHKPYVVATVTPAPVVAPVVNNGQVQWTTAYAPQAGYVQPQTQVWQQSAPQVQPQQWSHGYATYGGYATYAPQQQAPVPQQQPVYTSYAQAYPPQEVIQTYTQVQPAAGYVQETVYRAPVPSPTAPQAQTAGTTVYYGSYY